MKTYTKEEKKEYFAGLRARWQAIKDGVTSGKLDEIKAIIAEHGLNVSPWSYAFTAASMKYHGFDGVPYLDCKTFLGRQAPRTIYLQSADPGDGRKAPGDCDALPRAAGQQRPGRFL